MLKEIITNEWDFIYLDMQTVHDEGDFFKALCSEMDIPESRGYALHRAWQGKHYVLCLDHIERMTNKLFSGDEQIELRGLAGSQDAPLTLLIASRSPLNELFPDSSKKSSPLYGICDTIEMPPFSQKEVRAFIETRLHSTSNLLMRSLKSYGKKVKGILPVYKKWQKRYLNSGVNMIIRCEKPSFFKKLL